MMALARRLLRVRSWSVGLWFSQGSLAWLWDPQTGGVGVPGNSTEASGVAGTGAVRSNVALPSGYQGAKVGRGLARPNDQPMLIAGYQESRPLWADG